MKALKTLFLAAFAVIAPTGYAHAQTAQVEVLTSVSAYPGSSDLGKDFLNYIALVNQMGEGVLQIKHKGGPETGPASEQGTMLANGIVDLLHTPSVYLSGRFPEADVFAAKTKSAAEVRAAGGVEIYNESLGKRLNSQLIAFADGDYGLYIFTTRKPKILPNGVPDLSGFGLRAIPLYMPVYEELGATSLVIPYGETYSALERGMIDGVGFTITDVERAGWATYLKYVIKPRMYTGSVAIFANNDSIKRLSPKAREILTQASLKFENDLYALYSEREKNAVTSLQKLGLEELVLSDEGRANFEAIAKNSYRSFLERNKSTFNIDLDEVLNIYTHDSSTQH